MAAFTNSGGEVKPVRLLVCAGSIREDSLHRRLAQVACELLIDAGAKASYIEVADYRLPLYNQDIEESQGIPDTAMALRNLLGSHDGLALASPEYNGSYSPLLKNTIDWVSRPIPGERHSSAFFGKVAGLMSMTPGPGGGREGLRHLSELLSWLGMIVTRDSLSISRSSQAFTPQGELARSADLQAAKAWAVELVKATEIRKAAK